MKKASLIIIFIVTIFSNLFAGGGKTSNYVIIDVFEQSVNFYYKSVNDTVKYLNKKGKNKFEKATVNIAFYDINNDSTFHLFDNSFPEKIVSFFYESYYEDSLKSIEFETCDNYYGIENIKNNRNISKRAISGKLFIITYSYQNNNYTMWTCNKTGADLQKFTVFKYLNDFKVDVFNKNILTIRHLGRNIMIDKKPY